MSNLAQLLADSAAAHPEAIALRHDDDTWTYRQLHDGSRAFAGHLTRLGVRPGDRVAVSLPNLPAYAVAYYAVLGLGGVVVPLNPLLKAREVDYHLRDAGASVVLEMPGEVDVAATAAHVQFLDVAMLPVLLESAEPVDFVERADDDTAVLLYTSGTTGRPKGAELTHRNLRTNAKVSRDDLLAATPDDVIMGCLPLFHVFGMTCGLNVAVGAGATLTLVPRFDPAKALEVLERDRVTVFEGVPTMYGALLGAGRDRQVDTSNLRTCISGGAPMPVELMRSFEERFGCVVLEGYGLSETAPVASFNRPHLVRKPGTVGPAIRGVQVRVVDTDGRDVAAGEVGEVLIRGENVMRGYWNRPQETAEAIRDGWFYSGDLGTLDDDGYLSIVDRTKDLVIRGGFNVYPREVEEVLYEHPAIVEAAVVGTPDEHLGEEVVAYVVVDPAAGATAEGIRDFVKERVAAYKYPRHVHVIEALPKGPTGKILKRELRG